MKSSSLSRQKLLIALIACTVSLSASAQSVRLEFNGKSGVWFPDEMSNRILSDVETVPLLKKKIQLLEESLKLSENSLNKAVSLETVEHGHMEMLYLSLEGSLKALEGAWEENDKLKRSKSPWWKHPAVWFTVGVVVTSGIMVGATQVIKVSK